MVDSTSYRAYGFKFMQETDSCDNKYCYEVLFLDFDDELAAEAFIEKYGKIISESTN